MEEGGGRRHNQAGARHHIRGGGGREAGQDHVRARGRLHVLRSPTETIFSAGGLLLQAGLGQLKLLAVRVPAILLQLELAVEVRGLDIRAARLVQQKVGGQAELEAVVGAGLEGVLGPVLQVRRLELLRYLEPNILNKKLQLLKIKLNSKLKKRL